MSNKNESGRTISKVLATGTFDILHVGHINYLTYAKSLGDYLFVHIESDRAVKRHKGQKRPIINQTDRQKIINSLKIVDETFIADGEKDAKKILQKFKPQVLVLAPKSTFDVKIKEAELKNILPNLKVVWYAKPSEQSTSIIIDQIIKNFR